MDAPVIHGQLIGDSWEKLFWPAFSRLNNPRVRVAKITGDKQLAITHAVRGPQAAPWELLIRPIHSLPTPGKQTLWITRYDPFTPIHVIERMVRQARALIVPSRWDQAQLSRLGVQVHVVPLGVPEMYRATPIDDRAICQFGTCAVDAHEVIDVFGHAFVGIQDVGLTVRLDGPNTFTTSDPRVTFVRLSGIHEHLAWYRSLTAYVSAARSCMGFSGLEAMACGRPVIAPAIGSRLSYLTGENGYPCAFSGWGVNKTHLMHQLRRVYLDRTEVRVMGERAAQAVAGRTTDRWADRVMSLWNEHVQT